jgi:hypothetical protein
MYFSSAFDAQKNILFIYDTKTKYYQQFDNWILLI